MNSNHCQLFTILIGFRTASPNRKDLVLAVLFASPLQGNHSKFFGSPVKPCVYPKIIDSL